MSIRPSAADRPQPTGLPPSPPCPCSPSRPVSSRRRGAAVRPPTGPVRTRRTLRRLCQTAPVGAWRRKADRPLSRAVSVLRPCSGRPLLTRRVPAGLAARSRSREQDRGPFLREMMIVGQDRGHAQRPRRRRPISPVWDVRTSSGRFERRRPLGAWRSLRAAHLRPMRRCAPKWAAACARLQCGHPEFRPPARAPRVTPAARQNSAGQRHRTGGVRLDDRRHETRPSTNTHSGPVWFQANGTRNGPEEQRGVSPRSLSALHQWL